MSVRAIAYVISLPPIHLMCGIRTRAEARKNGGTLSAITSFGSPGWSGLMISQLFSCMKKRVVGTGMTTKYRNSVSAGLLRSRLGLEIIHIGLYI